MSSRLRLFFACLLSDAAILIAADVTATALRGHFAGVPSMAAAPASINWSLAVLVIAVTGAFLLGGLYEHCAFTSRRLQVWTIVRASVLAFFISAAAVYLLKLDSVEQSRFILLVTFALFVVFDTVIRVGIIGPILRADLAREGMETLLVGDSSEAERLATTLKDLWDFRNLSILPSEAQPDIVGGTRAWLTTERAGRTPSRSVFIDSNSVEPRDVVTLTQLGNDSDADVYVLSRLLGPLEGNTLLKALFHAPVIRVRRPRENLGSQILRRGFDVVGSATLLVLAAPVMAGIAIAIKATSPGPVFYRQTRIGKDGKSFEFFKFRSMREDNDPTGHEAYVLAFMAGEAPTVLDEAGKEVFKQVDDPRITKIGRLIRKYSLDEIPQFWNALRGDMALVGPRPPVPYEVEAYDELARMRLRVKPGVTGMWQVAGRSRVTFDEMIMQDLLYVENRRLSVDIQLCLLTVPAALTGQGAG